MPQCLFIFAHSLTLICLSCVTTSICLSLLAIVCDNNSVIHSSGKTLKWCLFSLLSQSIRWVFFIGRAVYQKQFCQSNVQNKQRGCETEYRHMRYNLAVIHASNVCARLYKQLCISQSVFGCVSFFFYGFHSSI